MCMHCYEAGDATSIFSSQMQWHKLYSLPCHRFSCLYIHLFVISSSVRYIFLCYSFDFAGFQFSQIQCRVTSHTIHQSCVTFPCVTPLHPAVWLKIVKYSLMERGLWGSSLLVQQSFEFLQGWRFHSLWAPAVLFDHLHWEEFFSPSISRCGLL